MDTSLKLGLLAVAALATIVALLFESVDEEKRGIRRVTLPGWISIILLLASTGLGTAQVFHDRSEAARLAEEKAAADAKVDESQKTIDTLKDTPAQLEDVRTKLQKAEELNAILDERAKRLDSELTNVKAEFKKAMDVRDEIRRKVEDLPKLIRDALPNDLERLLGIDE